MEGHDDDEARTLESISRVLRGDAAAFELIVSRYQGQVVRICRSVLRNREDAEDAAQEVFTRAFRSLATFHLDRRFRPWIAAIALNTSRRRYRTGRRRAEREPPIDGEVASDDPSPEGDCERDETRREVLRAVDRLPERLRGAVILYYLEGFRVAEVAEALSLTQENIKSRLHRARGVLRELLAGTATEGAPDE